PEVDELRERRAGALARPGAARHDGSRAEAPTGDAAARAAAQGRRCARLVARATAQRSAGAAPPGADPRADGADAEARECREGDERRAVARCAARPRADAAAAQGTARAQ